jgi:WLM domain
MCYPGLPLIVLDAPTRAAQAALLLELRAVLEPVLVRAGLPLEFVLVPGLRLRRAYGRCTWRSTSSAPVISVRCTADGDRTLWRRRGAIVGTLLHELAHLRYRSHGPRFWALHRRLVDLSAGMGVYDPTDRDPSERARGDEKLAASAAWPIALAARQRRLERARRKRGAAAN